MKDRHHDEAMAEILREDPSVVTEILNGILEDGDQAELMITLRQMTKAFGGVSQVARDSHLNTTQLYRTLSPNGNPRFSSLAAVLKAMGLRLAVRPVKQAPPVHHNNHAA